MQLIVLSDAPHHRLHRGSHLVSLDGHPDLESPQRHPISDRLTYRSPTVGDVVSRRDVLRPNTRSVPPLPKSRTDFDQGSAASRWALLYDSFLVSLRTEYYRKSHPLKAQSSYRQPSQLKGSRNCCPFLLQVKKRGIRRQNFLPPCFGECSRQVNRSSILRGVGHQHRGKELCHHRDQVPGLPKLPHHHPTVQQAEPEHHHSSPIGFGWKQRKTGSSRLHVNPQNL